jgi:hypothetical protein
LEQLWQEIVGGDECQSVHRRTDQEEECCADFEHSLTVRGVFAIATYSWNNRDPFCEKTVYNGANKQHRAGNDHTISGRIAPTEIGGLRKADNK